MISESVSALRRDNVSGDKRVGNFVDQVCHDYEFESPISKFQMCTSNVNRKAHNISATYFSGNLLQKNDNRDSLKPNRCL